MGEVQRMIIGLFLGRYRLAMIFLLAAGVSLGFVTAIRRSQGLVRGAPVGVRWFAISSALVSTAHAAATCLPNVQLADVHVLCLLAAEALLFALALVWGVVRAGIWGAFDAFGTYCVGLILSSSTFSLVTVVASFIVYVITLLGCILVLVMYVISSGDPTFGDGSKAVAEAHVCGPHGEEWFGYFDDKGNVRNRSGDVVLEGDGHGNSSYYDGVGTTYELESGGKLVARE